ncbi:MAG: hypothetical protein KA436_08870 [Oligoflexales bacterium]|nr:hypothetical protein [Oligoflexales bacterium]
MQSCLSYDKPSVFAFLGLGRVQYARRVTLLLILTFHVAACNEESQSVKKAHRSSGAIAEPESNGTASSSKSQEPNTSTQNSNNQTPGPALDPQLQLNNMPQFNLSESERPSLDVDVYIQTSTAPLWI